ncbi:MAG: PAS domain S-box protein [Methanolobus sp.]|nr:PAS domain S-box protein [Methanolobus sp.]
MKITEPQYSVLIKELDEMNISAKNKDLIKIEKSLKRRLEYEMVTVKCMRLLLEPDCIEDILPKILEEIHQTVKNSRTYIFKNEEDPEFGLCMSQVNEVVSEGIEPQIDNSNIQHLPYSEGAPTLLPTFEARNHYAYIVEELDDPEKTILAEQGILSILLIPIFAGPEIWGFIGFDDCVEARRWHKDDINLLTVIADGIGESICHKKAENELRESEERFKALQNASFGGVFIHDDNVIIDCNLSLSGITGYAFDELIGMDGILLIAEGYRNQVINHINAGYEEPYEAMGRRKDGAEYPLWLEAKNIPYKGKMLRVVEFRDITKQKHVEEALMQNEAKLSAMIANSNGIISIIDKDGINRYESPNVEKWFGWKTEELVGASVWNKIHPDDLEDTKSLFSMLLSIPKAKETAEARYRCKDGTYKWIEFTAINLLHEPTIKGMMLNYHDITERKLAEDSLRESEAKFRNYIENAPYGIFIADENWKYLEVNKTASIITGYTVGELLDMSVFDLISPEFQLRADQGNYEVKNNGFTTIELLVIHKDKNVYWMRMNAIKLSETRHLVFTSDITEKKKAEHSLIQAKMLAEENNRIKSEFLANMSHELRTPLTTIIGFSDILSSNMFGNLNEKQARHVAHISKSGKHLLEVINEVLDLSKIEAGKMELDCEYFAVSETLTEIQASMYPLANKKNIDLKLLDEINGIEIFADRLKFKQIMFNLLSNAIKFTSDTGEVTVIGTKTDNGIQISVSDTGIGIPEHMMDDIFNPFMQIDASNKRKYGGTGLGLALVKRFVEMHNGKIWFKSKEEKGSTFSFIIENQNSDNK